MTRSQALLVMTAVMISLVDGVDTYSIGFVGPLLAHKWGLGASILGAVFSASLVGSLVGALLSGPLTKAVGLRFALCLCLLWFGLGAAATTQVDGGAALIGVRLFTGCGLGAAIPLVLALAAGAAPIHARSRALGLALAGLPMGGVLAAALAIVVLPYDWRLLFVAGALLPLLIIPVVLTIVPKRDAPPEPQADTADLQSPVRMRRLLVELLSVRSSLVMTVTFLGGLLIYLLVNWVPTLLTHLGANYQSAALSGSMLNAGAIIASFAFGYLMDKLGVFKVGAVGFLAAAPLIAIIGRPDWVGPLLNPVILTAGLFVVGAQLGGSVLLSTSYAPDVRIPVISIGYALSRVGAAIGPLLAGVLLAAGLSVPGLMALAAALALVGAASIARLGFMDAQVRRQAAV